MAYHDIQEPLQKVLGEFGQTYPDGGPMLERLRDFGVKDTNHGVSEHDLYSALCVLLTDHLSSAIERITGERGIKKSNARAMMQRVLTPLSAVLGHEEMVSRGAIAIGDQYYIAKEEHDAKTGFDRQRGMVRPAYRPIMEAVLEKVYGRSANGEHRISAKQSLYVLALLLPEGREKEARMNVLSTSENGRNTATTFFEAAELVLKIADDMNIVVKKGELVSGMTDVEKNISAIREEFQNSERKVPPVLNSTGDALRDILKALIDDESITRQEAQIYYSLNSGKAEQSSDKIMKNLIRRSGLSEQEILDINNDVRRVLEEYEAPTARPEPSTAPRPSREARI